MKRIKTDKKIIEAIQVDPNFATVAREWMEKHQTKFIAGLVGFFAMGACFWAFNAYTASREKRAEADYALIVKAWPEMENPSTAALESVAAELEKHLAQHGGSATSRNAQMDLARAYFQMGRYDEALKWNKQVIEGAGSDKALITLSRYQMAMTLNALGKTDEAMEQWKALRAEGDGGLAREAEWHLGRAYFLKGDFPKAVEHYENALKSGGGYPGEPLLQSELAQARSKGGLSRGELKGELPGSGG